MEYEAEQGQLKDGAGGGPAEERTCMSVHAGTWHATAQDRGIPDSDARTG